MDDNKRPRRPAVESGDKDPEQQAGHAHATFRDVDAECNAGRMTRMTRMVELERVCVCRHPKRTRYGSGAALADDAASEEAWSETIRGAARRLDTDAGQARLAGDRR